MADSYSGFLTRYAHYKWRPPVPGVSADHGPAPDSTIADDPFQPEYEAPAEREHNIWQPQDVSAQSEMVQRPISHWADLQDPVPSSVPVDVSTIAATARMIANHCRVDYRPDPSRYYKHATQGRSIEYIDGRRPQLSGVDAPEFLVAGKNSFDFTNQPNEVYQGDSANVGRYRVGSRIDDFGRYEFSQKQGQDAWLRAYSGLHPQVPVDKPRVPDSAPYTPNSSGTTTWTLNSFQDPSLFSLPSETAVTDYVTATEGEPAEYQPFDDGGRL